MKKCAKCDREYEDSYDACPHCSAAHDRWQGFIGALLVLSALFLCAKCSGSL